MASSNKIIFRGSKSKLTMIGWTSFIILIAVVIISTTFHFSWRQSFEGYTSEDDAGVANPPPVHVMGMSSDGADPQIAPPSLQTSNPSSNPPPPVPQPTFADPAPPLPPSPSPVPSPRPPPASPNVINNIYNSTGGGGSGQHQPYYYGGDGGRATVRRREYQDGYDDGYVDRERRAWYASWFWPRGGYYYNTAVDPATDCYTWWGGLKSADPLCSSSLQKQEKHKEHKEHKEEMHKDQSAPILTWILLSIIMVILAVLLTVVLIKK